MQISAHVRGMAMNILTRRWQGEGRGENALMVPKNVMRVFILLKGNALLGI